MDCDELHCAEVVVFYFSGYRSQTRDARAVVRRECELRSLLYTEDKLDHTQPHANLLRLESIISGLDSSSPVVVDISTMPREVIWQLFWLCETQEGSLDYRYHSPADYSDEWLSRDPGRPRLVHKLSGIASPQAKTALLLAVGYDDQRVAQLVRFFEPSKLMLGLQVDSPFPSNDRMMRRYVSRLRRSGAGETFEIDAFEPDHGYHTFEEKLVDVVSQYNVVLGSLGPKLSAVSLFRIRQRWPHVALV